MSNNDLPCTRCKGQHHPADECCPIDYKKLYSEAQSLIDGVYEMVERYQTVSPAQVEWKKNWLENARKHGASGE
jgi:hypothetical protein